MNKFAQLLLRYTEACKSSVALMHFLIFNGNLIQNLSLAEVKLIAFPTAQNTTRLCAMR